MTALRILIAIALGFGFATSVFQWLQHTESEDERRRKAWVI